MAKVVFVQDLAYEYFGTMHISAYIKQHGHACDIFIEQLESRLLDSVLAATPDLIAFSCLTPNIPWALSIARSLKQRTNTPIIVGGVHVTMNPDDVFDSESVDMVCIGEGERPMKTLCDALDTGADITGIENLWVKQAGKTHKNPLRCLLQDLDTLPFADRELYMKYPVFGYRKVKAVLLGRGCPYRCNYCHNHAKMKLFKGLGKYVRFRSVAHVTREMDELIEKYGATCLHFIDDSFGMHKTWLEEFLPGLKARGIRFIGAVRANCVDEDICRLFKENGCDYVAFAVETGDEDFRMRFLKKTVSDFDLKNAARLFRKYGIPFLTMNMVGLPEETVAQTLQTLKLNIQLRPIYACCYIYQPYPNTELFDYSVTHGLMDTGSAGEIGLLSYDSSVLKQPDIKVQKNIQRLFALTVMVPGLFPLVRNAVTWRPNFVFDGIFYSLYAWYLFRFFRLTPRMIHYNIACWIRYQWLKRKKTPTVT